MSMKVVRFEQPKNEHLRHSYRRVPFKKCPNCGDAQLFKAYHPGMVGLKVGEAYCMTCSWKG